MSVFWTRNLLVCLLLICAVASLPGCSSTTYQDVHVDIDYYIVNLRADEILVRNCDGESGIVGFFLEPGEIYHFTYHDDMAFAHGDDEERGPHIIFDLYARGQNDRFEQYIGCCEFHPLLGPDHVFAETCFVD